MTFSMLARVIWPERKSVFLVVAAIAGLLADLASFLSNLTSPLLFFFLALGLAAAFAWPCFPNLKKLGEDGSECRECSAFRLCIYVAIALGIMLIAGQGQTLTERVGAQLGLIQQDVAVIREDTAAIREVTAASELVRNPRTPADRYRNAWLYESRWRDSEAAWREIQALYAQGPANKIDAAELFFRAGLAFEPRDTLIARTIEIGRAQRDAAMLVVAARQKGSGDEALTLMAEARAIDPDMPFAHWDPGVARLITHDGSAGARYRAALAEIEQLEGFLDAAQRRRVADYYFMPQFQEDLESIARKDLRRQRERLARREERARRLEERARR